MKKTNIVVLGRLLPDSGKGHQNQEVYYAGGVKYAQSRLVTTKTHLKY